jgi:hypothetical protein
MISKDAILNARDFDIERMDVPEWGGELCLKPMSVYHKTKIQSHFAKKNKVDRDGNVTLSDASGLLERILIYTICDESGDLVFTESDIDALSKKNGVVIAKVAMKAKEVSGMNETQEELIELEKKS